MNIIIDKIPIICLCVISFIINKSFAYPVLGTVTVIGLSAFIQCFKKSRLSLTAQLIYALLCFINPLFCCGIPLILYDCLLDKRYKLSFLFFLPFILSIKQLTMLQISLITVSSLISVLLFLRTSKLSEVSKKLITLRDTSEENAILLKEKNRSITERQDYEIHLATLKERNRIARDIHDNVGHLLTRSILQIGALGVINKNTEQYEYIEEIKNTLDNAMTTIRQSVHNLHDDSIDLYSAINDIIKNIPEKYTTDFKYDISDELPKKMKLCFIGIVKECTSNIIRHSNGDKIEIIIREHPAFYQLCVSDNGVCSDEIKNTGIGLSNMTDRIQSVSGIITFNPTKKGFKVFASAPKNFKEEN